MARMRETSPTKQAIMMFDLCTDERLNAVAAYKGHTRSWVVRQLVNLASLVLLDRGEIGLVGIGELVSAEELETVSEEVR